MLRAAGAAAHRLRSAKHCAALVRLSSTAGNAGSAGSAAHSTTQSIESTGSRRKISSKTVAFIGAGKMAEAMGGKENVGFTATATIKRSDFGISMGIPLVSDEVKLNIAAAFVK